MVSSHKTCIVPSSCRLSTTSSSCKNLLYISIILLYGHLLFSNLRQQTIIIIISFFISTVVELSDLRILQKAIFCGYFTLYRCQAFMLVWSTLAHAQKIILVVALSFFVPVGKIISMTTPAHDGKRERETVSPRLLLHLPLVPGPRYLV